jgi:DNA-binding PadR family transcriptional regulator
MNEEEIQEVLDESVEQGLIEVIGTDTEGNDIFAMTAKGRAVVSEYLDDALEQTAVVFAERFELPLYIARDLLFKRAADLRALDQ